MVACQARLFFVFSASELQGKRPGCRRSRLSSPVGRTGPARRVPRTKTFQTFQSFQSTLTLFPAWDYTRPHDKRRSAFRDSDAGFAPRDATKARGEALPSRASRTHPFGDQLQAPGRLARSKERRVGKECR